MMVLVSLFLSLHDTVTCVGLQLFHNLQNMMKLYCLTRKRIDLAWGRYSSTSLLSTYLLDTFFVEASTFLHFASTHVTRSLVIILLTHSTRESLRMVHHTSAREGNGSFSFPTLVTVTGAYSNDSLLCAFSQCALTGALTCAVACCLLLLCTLLLSSKKTEYIFGITR